MWRPECRARAAQCGRACHRPKQRGTWEAWAGAYAARGRRAAPAQDGRQAAAAAPARRRAAVRAHVVEAPHVGAGEGPSEGACVRQPATSDNGVQHHPHRCSPKASTRAGSAAAARRRRRPP